MVARQAVQNDREYQRLIRQGDEALRRGQPFGAIEAFNGAIERKPGSMLAYLKRGEARHQTGAVQRSAQIALDRHVVLRSARGPLYLVRRPDFQ